jgi:hypothetical protein
LIQWLEEFNTAYHAGNYTMNLQSIGIEHEDGGDYNGVRPDVLYTTSAKLVNDICNFYQIPIDRVHILKHSEVIATGCPDALDVDRIVREALALNTPPLQGLAIQVGYNPTFEGQDVMVNGVHYKSIKVNNVLVWKIEDSTPQPVIVPISTPTPVPTQPETIPAPSTPVEPPITVITDQPIVTIPISPKPVQPTQTPKLSFWQKLINFLKSI